jgi:hypothetical protein
MKRRFVLGKFVRVFASRYSEIWIHEYVSNFCKSWKLFAWNFYGLPALFQCTVPTHVWISIHAYPSEMCLKTLGTFSRNFWKVWYFYAFESQIHPSSNLIHATICRRVLYFVLIHMCFITKLNGSCSKLLKNQIVQF